MAILITHCIIDMSVKWINVCFSVSDVGFLCMAVEINVAVNISEMKVLTYNHRLHRLNL